MKQHMDFSGLESETWKIIFQNGLVDIMIGSIYLISTICSIFDSIRYYLYPLFLLPGILFIIGWKILIIPRLGVINFKKSRQRKNRSLIIGITIPLVILVGIRLFNLPQIIPGGIFSVITICAIILAIFFSIAYFMNFRRMSFYGILVTASFLLQEFLRGRLDLIFLKSYSYLPFALIIIVTGSILLNKFIKTHALHDSSEFNEE
ncbi:MAG: hypothetical protein MUP70_16885 [Candidatus Aminicenantes bacterium]|nr:hypothetical protein [Candidatus Aminicenantes bacterium]